MAWLVRMGGNEQGYRRELAKKERQNIPGKEQRLRHESISPTYRSTWKRAGGGGASRKIGWGYGCNIEKLDVIKCNGVCDRI